MKTIVCLGDSITFGYDSHTNMNNFKQVDTPYPKALNNLLGADYNVINSGNTGWHAKTTYYNLDNLVFKHNPDTVILMLGINDARGSCKGLPRLEQTYIKYMQKIVDEILAKGINLYILSPTPVINKRVAKFNKLAIDIARKNNLQYIDMHLEIKYQLERDKLQLTDILADNVHLSDDYYIIVAEIVFKNFNL